MAETASVLSPHKTVLIPDVDAGCSLADAITPDQLRAWQAQHPGAITVMYVNTTADRKSTRLNSSHGYISYAVFCLKKKKTKTYGSFSMSDTVSGNRLWHTKS